MMIVSEMGRNWRAVDAVHIIRLAYMAVLSFNFGEGVGSIYPV